MAGQWLVFWCTVLGLVVIVLGEVHRYRHDDRGRGLGRTPNDRLHDEIDRHGGSDESPL